MQHFRSKVYSKQVVEKRLTTYLEEKTKDSKLMTFKVNAKRLDKRFPMKSPEMSIDLGGYVLKTFPQRFKVDVVNPDLNITAELRADSNIIFADKIKGVGGLPRGINGKGCILLSGGIDSPVAAYLMSKRGLYIEAVHFHSFPFTSEKSQEKIMDLARTLLPYTGQIKIHMVNKNYLFSLDHKSLLFLLC